MRIRGEGNWLPTMSRTRARPLVLRTRNARFGALDAAEAQVFDHQEILDAILGALAADA